MLRLKFVSLCLAVLLGAVMFSSSSRTQEPNQARQPMVYEDTVGGLRVIEEGQPPVQIHATLDEMKRFRATHPNARPGQVQAASTTNDLYYHGGIGGIGVETAPKIYLVLWGSQWNGNDPSGEAGILESFYRGVGGSSWLNSVTQFCQGVASGTFYCNGAGTAAGNQTGIFAGVWADNASSAPSKPRQSQIAAEAVRAAAHFGNTTAASNASAQYVIATSTGNNLRPNTAPITAPPVPAMAMSRTPICPT